MKINVVFFVTGLGMGGAEKQVCLLADRFAESGHSVTVISLTGDSIVKPNNPKVKLIELQMKKTLLGFLKAYLNIKKTLKEIRPDVVHSHMFHANIMARLTRIFTKINRLICTAHNTNEGGKLRMSLYRWTNFLSDLNTNVSNEAVQSFVAKKAFKSNQMQVLYNGIDTNAFVKTQNNLSNFSELVASSDASNSFNFIAVGRLMEQKDYPNLLQAVVALKERSGSFCVWIVGEGELESSLKRQVSELGIDSQVRFLGRRNDVVDLMSNADAYVLSSAWEGFPLVIIEAMACSMPIVATDCGGVREALDDCVALVPPRESQLLAQAMEQMINMPLSQREELGRRVRERCVAHFSIEVIVKQWLELYVRD